MVNTWTMKGKHETWTDLYIGDYRYPRTLRPEIPKRKERKPPTPLVDVRYGPFLLMPVYRMGRGFSDVPRFSGWLVTHPDTGSEWGAGPFYRQIEEARGFARNIADAFAGLRNLSPIDDESEVAA